MKKLCTFLSLLLLSASLMAQTPQAINYQGVVRNNSGSIIANQLITLRLSILGGGITGSAVYVEMQGTTSDANGLFAEKIGQGSVISGTFSIINWGANIYFLKVEIDPAGGTNFTLAGTSQFASVPYSIYAKTAENGVNAGQNPGDLLYWNGTTWAIIPAGTHGQQLSLCNGVPTWDGCPPLVTTTAASNITSSIATSGGNVTAQGSSAVTARGVCWSTSPNPTVANSKTIDGSGTGLFTSILSGLNANTLYYVRAYATNSTDTAYGSEVSFIWMCGTSTITINHVAGTTAPVTKTVTYGTVTNIPGEPAKCWITKNLGATNQATAVSDATEAAAGWYWQFNRKQGFKHNGTTRTPATTWISSISENTNWTTANDPCAIELGSGWRLPTSTEWTNVDASGGWTTWTGPWNSGLKLHAAGLQSFSDGGLHFRGSDSNYWSRTQNSTDNGLYLSFGSGNSNLDYADKACGFTARCLTD